MRKMERKSRKDLTTIRIGKRGITSSLIEETSKNLKKTGIVKERILKTGFKGRTTKEIAEKIAEATDSNIVRIIGHTFTLRKAKRSEKDRYL